MGILARLVGRDDTITLPGLDGVLRPNSVLDEAASLANVEAPDDLAVAFGSLFISSGKQLLRVKSMGDAPEPWRSFAAPIAALAAAPGGRLAVALSDSTVIACDASGLTEELTPRHALPGPPSAMCFMPDGELLITVGASGYDAEWRRDLLSEGRSGSVWLVAGAGSTMRCLAGGLSWASGVIAPGGSVIVAEAWRHRLVELRPGLPPVPAGAELPGYPGRLKDDGGDGLLLSMFAPRSRLVELVIRQKQYRRRMLADLQPDDWIAPSLRSGRSLTSPMQGGAVRVQGVFKPWAPSFSFGLVLKLDTGCQPRTSFHSRADGRRHGITACLAWQGDAIFASKGDDTVGVLTKPLAGGNP